MCLAIPGKIKQINGAEAVVEYPNETRKVFLGNDVKVEIGNFVLVQMGVVVKKISPEEAKTSLEAWMK
jgi:hydrogenase assembly chaperone HypC/HupF